jgi:MFS family permease
VWVPVWLHFAPRGQAQSSTSTTPLGGPLHWPWQSILRSSPFWAMSACVFFFSYYWYFLLTWLPSYLTIARGYSTIGMGETLSVPLFAMAVVNIVAGVLADRLVATRGSVLRVRVLFASFGLVGASAILFLNMLPGRAPVLPILAVSICSFGLASSNFWAIAQYTSPSVIVGRAIGYLNTLSQIGGIFAPLVTGWSLGPHRDFKPAILIAGLCPIASVILLAIAGPKKLNQLKAQLEGAFS